jgi:UDP-glucose 4-epimerase
MAEANYIHVNDLARAHYLALRYLFDGGKSKKYNLGNGSGYSMLDVINVASQVSGRDFAYKFAEQRAGDPAILVSAANKATRELCWKPEYKSLESIIQTAWDWQSTNPDGYTKTSQQKD